VQCSLYRGRHHNLCFYVHVQNTNDIKSTQKDPHWENGHIVKTPYPGEKFSEHIGYSDQC
jgi:hypothetical protein